MACSRAFHRPTDTFPQRRILPRLYVHSSEKDVIQWIAGDPETDRVTGILDRQLLCCYEGLRGPSKHDEQRRNGSFTWKLSFWKRG